MYQEALEKLQKKASQKGIPLTGTFELTERCNFGCSFCYVCDRQSSLAMAERSTQEWLDIIQAAADQGMFVVCFTGGEVFTRPDFEELYCKTYDMGTKVTIFSNGSLIGERQRAFLKKRPPDRVDISLYGMSEKSYESTCGQSGAYYTVFAAIDELLKDNIPVSVKTNAMAPLKNDYAKMAEYVRQKHLKFRFSPYLGPERGYCKNLDTAVRMNAEDILEIQKMFKSAGVLPKYERDDKPRKEKCFRCSAGKSSFFINAQGLMTTCAFLQDFIPVLLKQILKQPGSI